MIYDPPSEKFHNRTDTTEHGWSDSLTANVHFSEDEKKFALISFEEKELVTLDHKFPAKIHFSVFFRK